MKACLIYKPQYSRSIAIKFYVKWSYKPLPMTYLAFQLDFMHVDFDISKWKCSNLTECIVFLPEICPQIRTASCLH